MGKKTQTLGQLIAEFKKVYGLGKFEDIHEGVHAMTGFGIGVADELRIAICETSLYNGGSDLYDAIWIEDNLRDALFAYLKGWDGRINAKPSALETAEYKKMQLATERLEKEEVEALYALGKKMHAAILKLTGVCYVNFTPRQVAALDFSKVDFVSEAQKIKHKFEKKENSAIAKKTAEIFYRAAHPANKGKIPAAGLPWHGPQMRSYAQKKKQVSL